MFRRFYLSILLSISFFCPLMAGEIPWSDATYYHFAQDQNLPDLIRDFTAIQGLDVVISSQVTGTVNGIFESIPPEEFWDNLTKVYNLTWFFDGSILYVYTGTEIRTEILQMSMAEANTLKAIVGELDFASANTSLRYLPEMKMLVVSGPPRFMEILHGFVDKVQMKAAQNLVDDTIVQVFPLKYAFAYDVSLDVGTGGGISIEGVSTMLQRILSGVNTVPTTDNVAVTLGHSPSVHQNEGVLKQKNAQGLEEAVKNVPSGQGPSIVQRKPASPEGKPAAKSIGGLFNSHKEDDKSAEARKITSYITSITYDARLNAVIIRDRRELMPFYQSLIERFDVPTKALEIQVAIVDVNVGRSKRMGLDVTQFLNGSKDITIRPTGGDIDLDSSNANFFGKFSRVIGDYDIAARVQALETASAAKTLSRPSVLTLDNIAAVISQSSQTYVQVEGSFSSDLFTISAEISLRVIPHIIDIERPDGTIERKVKLFVNIQDGSISPTGGSNGMPSVSNSQISTQSVLNEGQSLVVGGYYHERHFKTKSGVPVLKKLPIVGSLFRQSSNNAETMERLFIISPRIVEVSANDQDPYSQFFRPTGLAGKETLTPEEFAAGSDRLPKVEPSAADEK